MPPICHSIVRWRSCSIICDQTGADGEHNCNLQVRRDCNVAALVAANERRPPLACSLRVLTHTHVHGAIERPHIDYRHPFVHRTLS